MCLVKKGFSPVFLPSLFGQLRIDYALGLFIIDSSCLYDMNHLSELYENLAETRTPNDWRTLCLQS